MRFIPGLLLLGLRATTCYPASQMGACLADDSLAFRRSLLLLHVLALRILQNVCACAKVDVFTLLLWDLGRPKSLF